MPATPAHEDGTHPELRRGVGGSLSLDNLSVVPCGSDCTLQLAADLWPAWRIAGLWEERVDAELPGDLVRLLPTLAFMPSTRLDGRWEPPLADAGDDLAEQGPPDGLAGEISDALVDALRERLYRSIFALGAAWAQTRGERS